MLDAMFLPTTGSRRRPRPPPPHSASGDTDGSPRTRESWHLQGPLAGARPPCTPGGTPRMQSTWSWAEQPAAAFARLAAALRSSSSQASAATSRRIRAIRPVLSRTGEDGAIGRGAARSALRAKLAAAPNGSGLRRHGWRGLGVPWGPAKIRQLCLPGLHPRHLSQDPEKRDANDRCGDGEHRSDRPRVGRGNVPHGPPWCLRARRSNSSETPCPE